MYSPIQVKFYFPLECTRIQCCLGVNILSGIVAMCSARKQKRVGTYVMSKIVKFFLITYQTSSFDRIPPKNVLIVWIQATHKRLKVCAKIQEWFPLNLKGFINSLLVFLSRC